MKYNIFKQFITLKECDILSSWITENQLSGMFVKSAHPGTIRRTSRFKSLIQQDVIYPSLAFDIQERIDIEMKRLFNLETVIKNPSFPFGMYASYGHAGDQCLTHKDPRWIQDHITYHFNIILNNFEGADLYIGGQHVALTKSDSVLYPVSEVPHYTTKLVNNSTRMFWCFGYCVPIQYTPFKFLAS